MPKRFSTMALLIPALLLAPLVAAGQPRGPKNVGATLTGYEEVPAISTTGHGTLELRIDEANQTVDFELFYADLEGHLVPDGTVTASHIHFGQRDVNGGVSVFLCGGGGRPACPVSGAVSGTFTAADVIGPEAQGIEPGSFDELLRAIRAGKTYVNVHTTRWPGGEIRGQIFDPDRR